MEWVTEGLIPLLGMLLSFGMVIAIMVILTRSRQRRLQMQLELQSKLIDRFGSSPELISFLQSPAGRQFVSGVQRGSNMSAREVLLTGIRRAIILGFLGIGFIALWQITRTEGLAWPGVLLLVLGLGHFAAALSTMYLSKSSEPNALPPTTES